MRRSAIAALALASRSRRRALRRRRSIRAARGSTSAQLVAIGPRPAGSPAIEQARTYIRSSSRRRASPSPNRRGTSRRRRSAASTWSTCVATIPGAQPEPDRHRRPLRHEAVPRVPVRRRERRRVERGVPDRAGARAQGAQEPAHDRARSSSTARKRSATSGRAPTTPTAAATTWTRRGSDGIARRAQGDDPRRHDRRPRPAHQARRRTRRRGSPTSSGRPRAGSSSATYFVPETTPIEDDHLPFLEAGVPSVDIIDLEYAPWHTAERHARHRQRAQPPDRRRRPAGRPAGGGTAYSR